MKAPPAPPPAADAAQAAQRRRAIAGTAAFAVAPLAVGGAVPWLLTRWRPRTPVPGGAPARALGAALAAAGAAAVADAFRRFAVDGLGTPAPVAPPRRLVITGPYRYVRNPMYVAVVSAVAGQALLLGRPRLYAYAAGLSCMVFAFVRLYEEPALARAFGPDYEEYRRSVPGWLPRRPRPGR